MKKLLSRIVFVFVCCLFCISCDQQLGKNQLRPPAYPLVTIDPYTSAWSINDNLYEGTVKHWTLKDFPLLGVIRVDGEYLRFMGVVEPAFETLAPISTQQVWTAKYTTTKPAENWMQPNFNDKKWTEGPAAFGTIGRRRDQTIRTEWAGEHIWVRRIVELPQDISGKNVYLQYSNDDDATFYINGVLAFSAACCNRDKMTQLPAEAVKLFRPGVNVIAAYGCDLRTNQRVSALLDFGIYLEKENTKQFNNTAVQTSVDVQATQTHYTFTCGKVDLKLTFTAPLLMNDLDLLSRPVNYVSYEITSNDGNQHDVELYFEADARWALNTLYQAATLETIERDGFVFGKTGSQEQNVLGRRGDDVRIDWGYFYMAAENDWKVASEGSGDDLKRTLSLSKELGSVKNTSGKIMLGYDDIYSIQYFQENLRPYWNRSGNENIFSQFKKAHDEYSKIKASCDRFDKKVMKDAIAAGGRKYAELCALAYRQSIAAHKLVQAPNGDLLWLSKENNSNGSIGTVDVTYPSSPLYLYYNPELAKGLLNHIFYFSESGKWTKPFAAHDVGTYPLANGQTYGGDMPVEESGNMLILSAAITRIEGNATYAEKHWEVLTTWADYLAENGLDPENQLCTDDFAGHFAHNANLSIKAILGVASYGYMADKSGKKEIGKQYMDKASEMAKEWVEMAKDGDHYKLTFDKSGTWSQKYNMVWDKLLGFNLFPKEVAQTEIEYYLTKQNKYGLPLDNRETYTKTDWIMWTATLANDKATFERFIDPLYLFMNETVDRMAMSDWVYTDRPNYRGFRARSVVGGYWIKMLEKKLQ